MKKTLFEIIKSNTIDHYEKMIKWTIGKFFYYVRKNNPNYFEAIINFEEMAIDIGENPYAVHCPMCTEYYISPEDNNDPDVEKETLDEEEQYVDFGDGCVNCPIYKADECCYDEDSLWNKMMDSFIYENWIQGAMKMIEFIGGLYDN
jgi:hypothetical protein